LFRTPRQISVSVSVKVARPLVPDQLSEGTIKADHPAQFVRDQKR
jgi:hypothetical protein